MPLLQIHNLKIGLSHGAQVKPIVHGVSFNLERGKTFALVGESGSGKTLTSLAIMQLLPFGIEISAQSQILLNDKDLLMLPEMEMRQIRGRHIGMIFQEPMTSFNPVLTIGQQIIEVLRAHKIAAGRRAKQRTLELLKSVELPNVEHIYECYPHELSGGMKQRAMIALALAAEPELLIADEPTSALDISTQRQILDLLKQIQIKMGMAVLLITHDLGVVYEVADEVAIMYAGKIVEQAPTAEFFKAPKNPYSQQLFASLPSFAKRGEPLAVMQQSDQIQSWIPRKKRTRDDSLADKRDDSLADKRDDSLADKRDDGLADHLTVNNLEVAFPIRKGIMKRTVGWTEAVRGVSLRLEPGKTIAVVGESGSGKTTLAKAVLQLIKPTGGTMNLNGVEDWHNRANLELLRRNAQIVFQDPFSSMDPRMLVSDIILEGVVALNLIKNPRERIARVDELLAQVNLPPDSKNRYPHEFSGGQRQRIAIARALAVEPKFIICDEPTSALDVSVQAQILNLLRRLQLEQQLAYLFITHNMAVVGYFADWVMVMYQGKVVEEGAVESVLMHPQHPYTRKLLEATPVVPPILTT